MAVVAGRRRWSLLVVVGKRLVQLALIIVVGRRLALLVG